MFVSLELFKACGSLSAGLMREVAIMAGHGVLAEQVCPSIDELCNQLVIYLF